jgi:hypothetical protein
MQLTLRGSLTRTILRTDIGLQHHDPYKEVLAGPFNVPKGFILWFVREIVGRSTLAGKKMASRY